MKNIFSILSLAFCLGAKAQYITTIAGSTAIGYDNGGFGGDGSLATFAKLKGPYKLCLDAKGNIYFADCPNHRIRKINTGGSITTIAGDGTKGFAGDGGLAVNASLDFPSGVCVDQQGNIYVADLGNNRIRKIDTNGVINTIAGSGLVGFGNGSYSGDGGLAVSATLHAPLSAFVDLNGNILISDTYNHCIRKVSTNGIITTIAGTGTLGYSGDGGQATTAMLAHPSDLTAETNGNILIADLDNQRIRKVDANGIITTLAGNGNPGYSGDGGTAPNASLFNPIDIDLDGFGNVYITENYNHIIRKIDTNGIISTIAGIGGSWRFSGDGGLATAAQLYMPSGMAYKNGKIYIADQLNHRIRMVCTSTVTFTLSASDTIVGCPNHTIALSTSGVNTYTYTWSTGQTGINNITVLPSVTGAYYVQARDTNGCVASSLVNLFVHACVGFEELSKNDQINTYPNPTISSIRFNVPFEATFDLEIFAIDGRLVFQQKDFNSNQNLQTHEYVSGIYSYRITTQKQVYQGKFIKD